MNNDVDADAMISKRYWRNKYDGIMTVGKHAWYVSECRVQAIRLLGRRTCTKTVFVVLDTDTAGTNHPLTRCNNVGENHCDRTVAM